MKALVFICILATTSVSVTHPCCYPCKSKDKKLIEAAKEGDLDKVNNLLAGAYTIETLEKALTAARQNNRRRASISIGHILDIARMSAPVTSQGTPQPQEMRPQANTI